MDNTNLETAAKALPQSLTLGRPATIALFSLATIGALDVTSGVVTIAKRIRGARKAAKEAVAQTVETTDTPSQ